ncbi:MAG: CDP-glycerol glycerophosphotransferase family protein, partial [Eubacterium sp.]|nr:CDP-glycerol glycerophosphotransferase family protein [Eubacterium sp.]
VTISTPFDIDITSPKVKIVFEYNGKTRRLPFLIRNFYRQKQNNLCVVICTHSYLLDYIFDDVKDFSEIKARIDLYYGENEAIALPFTISDKVIHDNPYLAVKESFIGNESFDGFTIFERDAKPDDNCKKSDTPYSLDFEPENGIIIISKGETRPENNKIKLSPILKFMFAFLKAILAIALLPLLIIAGIIAGATCVVCNVNNKKSRKKLLVDKIINVFSFFFGTNIRKTRLYKSAKQALKKIRKKIKRFVCHKFFDSYCKKPIVQNRITFMSGRRDELGGNYEFVYNLIKDREDIDFQFLMFSNPAKHDRLKTIKKFLYLYATSKVVIVDDYFRLLNTVKKRKSVTVIQLWHACGAFKTFGFTRLGKSGGPKQNEPNHRMYDYAIVSSQEIAKHYAEGFGISDDNVVATGIPRTDVFMNKEYADDVSERFFRQYPNLKSKKIILFAPTFRGKGQMSAYYPKEAFHPEKLLDKIGNDYAILIKLHPYCKERFEIAEEYRDRIIDFSDAVELNDLLFVTDLLITDYSSVIFEASLLDIPMLFYTYDLYLYIKERDFYYDFENFVPGKILYSENEIAESIESNNFEQDKV